MRTESRPERSPATSTVYCSNIQADVALGRAVQHLARPGRTFDPRREPADTNGGWVATHEDVTERKRSDERIAHLAHYDALTDLPNRVLFHEQLDCALETIAGDEQLAVLYIDIDRIQGRQRFARASGRRRAAESGGRAPARLPRRHRFRRPARRRRIRDHSGHGAATGRRHRPGRAASTGQSAIRSTCAGQLLTTDASIGIALAPRDGTDLDQLLKNADLAMYGAKADGRADLSLLRAAYGCAGARRSGRWSWICARRSPTAGFELHYQPHGQPRRRPRSPAAKRCCAGTIPAAA